MFNKIIDIKTYLTNIQTPQHLIGVAYCVYVAFWDVWEEKTDQSKSRKQSEEKERHKGIKSTYTRVQRSPCLRTKICIQVKAALTASDRYKELIY